MTKLSNVHPGEVLLEEFLIPLGISQYKLAKAIGVTQPRISAICQGKRAITADTAVRLSRFFGTTVGGEQATALFGSFAIGIGGYAAVVFQVLLIAGVTAFTSRQTVNRTLETID